MPKDVQIGIRCSAEEKKELAKAAARVSRSISDWARLTLLAAARAEKKTR